MEQGEHVHGDVVGRSSSILQRPQARPGWRGCAPPPSAGRSSPSCKESRPVRRGRLRGPGTTPSGRLVRLGRVRRPRGVRRAPPRRFDRRAGLGADHGDGGGAVGEDVPVSSRVNFGLTGIGTAPANKAPRCAARNPRLSDAATTTRSPAPTPFPFNHSAHRSQASAPGRRTSTSRPGSSARACRNG